MSIGGVPADRGVTARNQQVISQPTGSAPFSDKSDAVWQKQGSPTCPPSSSSSLHLLHHSGEMKTNTGGFVPQENPAALNSHRSSQALPSGSCGNKQQWSKLCVPGLSQEQINRRQFVDRRPWDSETTHTRILPVGVGTPVVAAELRFLGKRVLPHTHIHLCYVYSSDLTG